MKTEILGVDIGGVLIDRVADGTDTSFFSQRYLETPAVAESFATLALLRAGRFGAAIHLVSKCGPTVEAKTRRWLAHHRFAEIAGVPEAHLHFCRERPDKAPICARLGVTHFVDDRLDVLEYLKTVGRRYLFQPRDKDRARAVREKTDVVVVGSWAEIARDLL